MADILYMKQKHPYSAVWTQCLNADCNHRWPQVFKSPVRLCYCPKCKAACSPGNCPPVA